MKYTFKDYPDRELMMMDLADIIASDLRAALAQNARASLAVPGGTTPGPVFDTLSAVHLDWDRVDVMLTDERWVPEESDRSNARLLKQRLFVGPAAEARFVPFYTGAPEPEGGLEALNDRVRAALPLSVVLLGMGADMHTASLFPGADRLAEGLDPHAPPLLPMRAEGAGEPRVTLTAPALGGAMSRHLVITGDEKRAALDRAAHLADPTQAPVAAVLRGMVVHWAP